MSAQAPLERNQDATCYVGDLAPQVTEELLWELFLQCGPVVNVYIPRDKLTQQHSGYGFVEFRAEEDAEYALRVMNMVNLFQRPIRVNKASKDKQDFDVGANLFVGNLDDDVEEKTLYDTFSAFGRVIQPPKIMRDPDTGNSRGFGFVKYDSFEAADAAIEAMSGQYLCNKALNVDFMYKKDSREKHGDPAERLLAAQMQRQRGAAAMMQPHTLFGMPGARAPAPPAPPPAGARSFPVPQPLAAPPGLHFPAPPPRPVIPMHQMHPVAPPAFPVPQSFQPVQPQMGRFPMAGAVPPPAQLPSGFPQPPSGAVLGAPGQLPTPPSGFAAAMPPASQPVPQP